MRHIVKTLDVALPGRSYRIAVGPGLLADPESYANVGRDVLVVSNTTVAPLYLERLREGLGARRVEAELLPDGEEWKTLATLEGVLDALVRGDFHRDVTLVALGGGVVGDITGFAAACYHRGVNWVQVPTTLLAQVDASVGGKTAVNHPGGKNLIGAFHQPRAVVADTDTLATLPEREFLAGVAEVLKYGIGLDADFLYWLEANLDGLLSREDETVTEAIVRSCAIKARVVAEDEREAGRRALLNLGHTFGHAIEAALGFGTWLHGEAVAAGMVKAAELSERLGRISEAQVTRVRDLVARAGLPTALPPAGAHRLRALMSRDKKVQAGRLRLVLLDGPGASSVVDDCPESALQAVLEEAGPDGDA